MAGKAGLWRAGAGVWRARRGCGGRERARAATASAPRPSGGGGAGAGTGGARETLAALRRELSGLIAARHHRTGQPHGVIHAELRRACGGPPVPEATAEQVRTRIAMLRRWAGQAR